MPNTATARHANAHPVFARILNSVFPMSAIAADIDDREALDAQDQEQAAKDERIRTGANNADEN